MVVFVEKQAMTYEIARLKTQYQELDTYTGANDPKVPKNYATLSATLENSANSRNTLSLHRGGFSPYLVELALGSVVIIGDQIQYLQRVQIQSNTTPPAAAGPLQAAPSSLSFTSDAANGATSGGAQDITLTNTGTTTPLTSITAQIPGSTEFAVVQPVNCPNPLPPTANCKISVTYSPSTTVGAGSTRTANLQVSYGPGSTPLGIALTGAASDTVYFSSTGLSLGTAVAAVAANPAAVPPVGAVAAKPGTATLTITNFKNAPIGVSVANPAGTNAPEFTYSANTCETAAVPAIAGMAAIPAAPKVLPVGQSCSVNISLTPTASGEGARTATMTVTYTISGTPQTQTVTLSGTGQ